MELLERHFEIAIETPDGINKLRQLILSLAMQGQLVKQDPKEQPACEFIRQISSNTKKVFNKTQMKYSETFQEIKAEEMPFPIPDGWEWVRLGVLTFKIGSGSTPRGGKNVYVNEGIRFLRSQNVWNDGIKLDDVAFIPMETHDRMSNTKVYPRDILLNITGASLGRSAIVPDDFPEANVSQHVTIIRLEESIDRKYLHYFILSPLCQSMIWERQVGMAREGLSKKVLEQFEIPFPPPNEQKRIVAKIDQLMSICDKLQAERDERNNKRLKIHTAAINKLLSASDKSDFNKSWNFITRNFNELYSVPQNVEELKKAILQLAVMGKLVKQDPNDQPASELLKEIEAEKVLLVKSGKLKKNNGFPEIRAEEFPFKVPPGWEWVRLSDLSSRIHYGYTASADYNLNEIRLLRITDIQNNKVNWKSVPGCNISEKEFLQYELQENDILIARTGGTVGKSYLVRDINIKAVFASYLIRVIPSPKLFVQYLKYFLECPLYWMQLYSRCSGTGQPNVNGNGLSTLVIPLPPLAEQKRIVAKIEQLFSFCDVLVTHLNYATEKQTAILNSVLAI